ncbi:MAG TPA: type II toxin-antitoxin system RelE/ParE family toxin [Tepidisphaeraceae bacterium]|nr:type II toxin-antitoxin system RelE/ParE family toxin [Tepidisphaeraceae bacterium]
MALKIIWSPHALIDAEEIAAYIARDSEAYAAGMMRRFVQVIERLLLFPKMGRRVPEFDNEQIRELIVRPYRIIYRVEPQRIVIAAIVHGARLLDRALEDRSI